MPLFSLDSKLRVCSPSCITSGFPGGSDGKESTCHVGDKGSVPAWGRSPGEGNGYPLQYFCLENQWMERPGVLQSMGSQRIRHDWETNTAQSVPLWPTAEVQHAASRGVIASSSVSHSLFPLRGYFYSKPLFPCICLLSSSSPLVLILFQTPKYTVVSRAQLTFILMWEF